MKLFNKVLVITLSIFILGSCTKRLDLSPHHDLTADQVYSTPAGYTQVMAKIYGSMALTGNSGAAGSPDISSQIIADEGNSDFLRMLWYLQCLSTDEAGWTYHNNTDPIGIHQMTWSSLNQTVGGLYYRCYFLITLVNDFLRESTDAKLASRNITGADATKIKLYREEARFVRGYIYWVLMDVFANVPFVDESNLIGVGLPAQKTRSQLFSWIETELKSIETTLAAPKSNEYGRADQAAVWALLSRMYLNAEVYTGTPKYTECITYSNKVIAGGYSLHGNYKELMLADNDQLAASEFIWTIRYDGSRTQNWGGTTTLTHGPAGVPGSISGTNGNWNCIRVTEQFVGLFDAVDVRGQFYTSGQNLLMNQLLDVPTDGYSSTKFRNLTRTGAPAPNRDPGGNWVDIDFPIFRLAEVYLNYAEAVTRGGTGGSTTTAKNYLDLLNVRGRVGQASNASVTLPYIIAERGRELFWECLRRTDLIRFGQFTTSTYLWAWKGGVRGGTAVDSKYNIFPIPTTDLTANPTLRQNPGY